MFGLGRRLSVDHLALLSNFQMSLHGCVPSTSVQGNGIKVWASAPQVLPEEQIKAWGNFPGVFISCCCCNR